MRLQISLCALLIAASALFAQEQPRGPFHIRIVPANSALPQGELQTFYVERVNFRGATQGLLNTGAHWFSLNTAIATVDPNTGMLTAVAQGTTTVTAASGPYRASTQITVSPIVLVAIQVTPANISLAGGTQQFTGTGFYSAGPSKDLTSQVSWKSSVPAVASITSSGGLATVGASLGSTVITASLNGVSGFTGLNAGLASIAITPNSATISQGKLAPFTALGTFSDSSVRNVSGAVTWASSAPATALISNLGVAQGVSPGGPITIQASSPGATPGSASLTVIGPPTLTSISVAPAPAAVATGGMRQFTATGHYSDGSAQNLNNVAWFSSDPTVATINAAGLASGVTAGPRFNVYSG